MRRVRILIVTLLTLAGTAGCSGILPEPRPPAGLHDFGPTPAATVRLPEGYGLGQFNAAPWLENRAIHYRLLYSDPTRLRRYAHNEWLAPPARLLAERLGSDASVPGAGPPRYRLNATLETFEQRFSAPQTASAVLDLRVRVIDTASGRVVAQKRFNHSETTEADVGGAIRGLGRAGERTLEALVDWLAELDLAPRRPAGES